jgi:hypothetical protein
MADSRPNNEGGEGDRDGLSSVSASRTTEEVGSGAASPFQSAGEEMEVGDMASATTTPSASFREHGYQGKGLEGVVEYWQRFHMRRGRCFAAP